MTIVNRFQNLYPFSAIVGQDSMKSALILNAVNPRIGGVLIRGEKGTAKSTAVRALAAILPEIEVSAGCPYSCDPSDATKLCDSCRTSLLAIHRRKTRVVELPLNATEEMIIGGLDFSSSVREGSRVFQPGLLARANRGFLYIDEVNLLSEHLTDSILCAAASGENVVQREGISFRHPSEFILVGTMNPEEGELRPQLLDRFGLCVEVHGERDLTSRVEVLRRRLEFERDRAAFCERFRSAEDLSAQRIAAAIKILPDIVSLNEISNLITKICLDNNVAGHRADMAIFEAAKALAALEGRLEIVPEDIGKAAVLALPHRARASRSPKEEKKVYATAKNNQSAHNSDEYPESQPMRITWSFSATDEETPAPAQKHTNRTDFPEAIFEIGDIFKVREMTGNGDKTFRRSAGKRSRTRSINRKGRYIRSTAKRTGNDIALDATLRAAAPYQYSRKKDNGLLVVIREEDIREKIRETRTGNFLLFLVDASGSMGAKGRMVASKGAVMSLLNDAYLKRDRVAMISFRRQEAVVNLPPTSSIHLAGEMLKELPVGGKTPLAAGLYKSQSVLRNVLLKDRTYRPFLIIITDGKANEGTGKSDPFWEALSAAKSIASDKRIKSIVVDAEEQSGFHYGLSRRLAREMSAEYVRIKDLRADILLKIVRKDF